ncbi:MAG: DUF3021 domain-containing protein [Ruminococcaceae bacterium]|nr:DUF3021 domain-containing protein [Oscillospiraceae bacterium]
MDIKKLTKNILTSACIYFTLINAVYMLFMTFITTGDDSPAIEASRVLLFFVFSLLWALADAIRKVKAIPFPLGRIIHFVICAFGFYSCFMLAVRMTPSNILTGLIIFSLVYWSCVGLKAFFSSRLKRNREQSQKYQGQFKNKK